MAGALEKDVEFITGSLSDAVFVCTVRWLARPHTHVCTLPVTCLSFFPYVHHTVYLLASMLMFTHNCVLVTLGSIQSTQSLLAGKFF